VATEILVDNAFDVDPFVLADLPFNAYYPLVVGPGPAPPPQPTVPKAVGGIGLPRRLPFWEAGATRISGEARGTVGRVEAALRTEEDELLSDDNRLLGLI
jgi:hypothetical protein